VKTIAACAALMVAIAPAMQVLAQTPGFAGTWTLDSSRSRLAASAAIAGLSGSGAPMTLHITQPANGTLMVESQINESHSRIYVPGRKTSTPITVGPPGSVSMTSKWDGRTLVSEGTRETTSGTSSIVSEVRETFSTSTDGSTLTLEVTTIAGGEKSASTLVYTRTKDVGPCRSWPTPCKVPS
jgi:hypothetical protein